MSDNFTKSFISESVDLALENKQKFMEVVKETLPNENMDRLYASFEYLALVCRHLALVFATTGDMNDEEKQLHELATGMTVMAYSEQLEIDSSLLLSWVEEFKSAIANFERNEPRKTSFVALLAEIYDWQMGGIKTRIEADYKSIMTFNALIMAMFAVEVSKFQNKLSELK